MRADEFLDDQASADAFLSADDFLGPAPARRGGTRNEFRPYVAGGEPAGILNTPLLNSDAGAGRGGSEFAATDPRRITQSRGGRRSEVRPYVAGDPRITEPVVEQEEQRVIGDVTPAMLLNTPTPAGRETDVELSAMSRSPALRQREIDAAANEARRQQFLRRSGELTPLAEQDVIDRVAQASLAKPLDNSLAGLFVEGAGDAIRGVSRASSNLAGSAWSALQAGAETLGADDAAKMAGLSGRAARESAEAIGNPIDRNSLTQQVFESTFTSVPLVVALGGGNAALVAMGAQAAAADYGESRDRGLSHAEAASRAPWMGIAEAAGERFGLPQLGRLFQAAAAKASTKDLGKILSDLLVKEQVGEQVTLALQNAYEVTGPHGTKPNLTLKQYLEEAANTAAVTFGQSLLTGGLASGVKAAARPPADRTFDDAFAADVASRDFLREPLDGFARAALAPSSVLNDPAAVDPRQTARAAGPQAGAPVPATEAPAPSPVPAPVPDPVEAVISGKLPPGGLLNTFGITPVDGSAQAPVAEQTPVEAAPTPVDTAATPIQAVTGEAAAMEAAAQAEAAAEIQDAPAVAPVAPDSVGPATPEAAPATQSDATPAYEANDSGTLLVKAPLSEVRPLAPGAWMVSVPGGTLVSRSAAPQVRAALDAQAPAQAPVLDGEVSAVHSRIADLEARLDSTAAPAAPVAGTPAATPTASPTAPPAPPAGQQAPAGVAGMTAGITGMNTGKPDPLAHPDSGLTDAQAVAALNTYSGAAKASLGDRTPMSGASFTVSPVRSAQEAPEALAARAMASALGKHVVIVRSATGTGPNGMTGVPGAQNVIFIREGAPIGELAVFGHELGHRIKTTNAADYAKLTEVVGTIIGRAKVEKKMADYAASGVKISRAQALEELTNDALGNRVTDTAFWNVIARRDGGLFRRLAVTVKSLIAMVRGGPRQFGRGDKLQGVARMLADGAGKVDTAKVEAVERAIDTVMSRVFDATERAAVAQEAAAQAQAETQGRAQAGVTVAAQQPSARRSTLADTRLQDQELRAELDAARADVGWQQIGGRILRDPSTAIDPNSAQAQYEGDVVGRTQWLGSDLWRNRPTQGGRVTEQEAIDAIDRALRGEPMSTRQRRFVAYTLDSIEDRMNADEKAAIEALDEAWIEAQDAREESAIEAFWQSLAEAEAQEERDAIQAEDTADPQDAGRAGSSERADAGAAEEGPDRVQDAAGAAGKEGLTAESSRKSYRNDAQQDLFDRQLDLFVSSRPDESQAGPAVEAARNVAAGALRDLYATGSVLARTLARDLAERQRVDLVGQVARTPLELAALAQVYRDQRFETFRLIFTGPDGRVVAQVGLTSRMPGSTAAIVGNSTADYGWDVAKAARAAGALDYYMLHNHPSGKAEPSSADIYLTESLSRAIDLDFKGHVVIDTNQFSVIDKDGKVTFRHHDFGQPAPFASAGEWSGFQINGPGDVMRMAERLAADDSAVTLAVLDFQHRVRRIFSVPAAAITSNKAKNTMLLRRAALAGAGAKVAAMSRDRLAIERLFEQGLTLDGIHLADDGRAVSMAEQGLPGGGGSLIPTQRKTRVTADTSEAFAYLRKGAGAKPAAAVAEPGPQDGSTARAARGQSADAGVAPLSPASEIDFTDPQSAADVLLAWGARARYQYPKTDAKGLAEIARAKGASAEEGTVTQPDGSEKPTGHWTITLPDESGAGVESTARLVVNGDRVHINVAGLKAGSGGSRVYDIAAQFALNNGKVFVGDPDGVSDAAMRRRLENMLSSAIKYGTTDHIAPHPRQLLGESKMDLPPLRWQTGDTRGNIYSMLRVADAVNEQRQPFGSAVGYDAGAGAFIDADGVPVVDAPAAFALLSNEDRGMAGVGAAGRTTLQRAALFRALLRSDSARRSFLGRLRRVEGDGSQATGRGAPELDRILYSLSDPGSDRDGSVDASGALPDSEAPARAGAPDLRFSLPTPVWDAPLPSKTDEFLRKWQDARVDLKRVQQAIETKHGQVDEHFDARAAETVFPGRVANRADQFLKHEVKPLLEMMARNNLDMVELSDFLHARHAPEANVQIAKVNPNRAGGIDAGENSKGVKMTTANAQAHLAAIPPARRMLLDRVAAKVDAIIGGTRDLLVSEGLEKQETIDAWKATYKHYVPLFKEETDDALVAQHPIGSGFQVKGPASKRRTGGQGQVTNMLAHVLMQREAAIARAEKNRVMTALYGMVLTYANPDFWRAVRPTMGQKALEDSLQDMGVDPWFAQEMGSAPSKREINKQTGLFEDRPNPMYRNLPNALTLRVNGEDRTILFNANEERSMRLALAMKNMDHLTALDWGTGVLGGIAKLTRYFAAINTQYNPAFGLTNMIRDLQGAAVNLSNTPLKGQQIKVLGNVPAAIVGISRELRGDSKRTPWSDLYLQFVEDGGQTGYRDLVRRPDERTQQIAKALDDAAKAGSLTPGKVAHAVLDVLDHFNLSIENGVRLSAYRAALDSGMSRQRAAQLARELTVDFNRKGSTARELTPAYAFLNAAIQGTARHIQALKGPRGAAIISAGLTLGVIQALLLAGAGFEDDEIPEFEKTRGLIIPTGGKRYFVIPMAIGLHILPNTGRVITELLMDPKHLPKRIAGALGEIVDAANPFGGGGAKSVLQGVVDRDAGSVLTGIGRTVMPTIVDPMIDIATNENFAGRKIHKETFSGDPRPGYMLARENTQRSPSGQVYTSVAKAINAMSGGNDFRQGAVSPAPEDIRYAAGVIGGGIYREMEKVFDASIALATGTPTPANRVPLGGRFAGGVDNAAVQQSRFYSNSRRLKRLKAEYDGFAKAGRDAEAEAAQANPEAQLMELNDAVNREITKLNKLAAANLADPAALKELDAARLELMTELNDSVRALERAARAR